MLQYNSLIEFTSGQITSIAGKGVLSLGNANSYIADAGSTTSNSALTGLSSNYGQISLAGGAAISTSGSFTNSGTLIIDDSAGKASNLTVGGSYTQGASGELLVNFDGTGVSPAAAVNVSGGAVTLNGGTLATDFPTSFIPKVGETFTVMTFKPGTLTGEFGTLASGATGNFWGNNWWTYIGNGLAEEVLYNNAAGNIQVRFATGMHAADDFNGDLASDILAGNSGGALVDLSVKNGTVSGASYVTTLSGGWSYLDSGYFDSNPTTDILAKDAAGDLVVLPVQNGTVSGSPSYVTTLASGWSYLGKGDYHGNGTDDLLVKDTAGDIAVLPMKNGTLAGAPSYVTTLPSGWSYLASGDFNADGTDDLLVQDKSGNLFDIAMSNGTTSGTSYLTTLSSGWSYLATGDFFGIGTADILVQDKAGDIVNLIVKNGTVANTEYVTTLSSGWSYLGAGSFFGTRSTDLLVHNASGDILALPMANGTVMGSPSYVTNLSGGWKFTA